MRLLTVPNLRWVVRHRAWTPYYLKRYWRFAWFRLRHPGVITEGFVFLGKNLEIEARRGHGRIILGRWVHLGDHTRLRAHEGTLRIGDKVVFARDITVNCYLDVEIGASTLIADWTYICDFDHKTEDLQLPIKDQGLVKSPVRIGPDCWLATKVTVTRGADIGRGAVIGANSVARGNIPPYSVAVGIPAKVVADRTERYAADAPRRRYLTGLAEANARTTATLHTDPMPTTTPPSTPPATPPVASPGSTPATAPAGVPTADPGSGHDSASHSTADPGSVSRPSSESGVSPADSGPDDGSRETPAARRSVVPQEAGSDEVEAGGEKEQAEGFSSYSPVGHYVPDVRSD